MNNDMIETLLLYDRSKATFVYVSLGSSLGAATGSILCSVRVNSVCGVASTIYTNLQRKTLKLLACLICKICDLCPILGILVQNVRHI